MKELTAAAREFFANIEANARVEADGSFPVSTCGDREQEAALLELLEAGILIQTADFSEDGAPRRFRFPFELETHNGYITVFNPKTGDHRTFRVWSETWNEGEPNEVTKRTVSLLTGPDREFWRDWTKFGDVRDGKVVVWRSKKGEDSAFEKFAEILNHPDRGVAYGLEYMLEGRCRRCNRPLSNPESIRSGIGPICSGHEREELEPAPELSHREKVQAAWKAERAREEELESESYSAARHSIIFAG